MIVSAESTVDPNGYPLQFDWILLRGDPERVRIEPLGPMGEQARITFNWHDPFVAPPRSPSDRQTPKTSRVDIGVFAWNGRTDSAPAFISVDFPYHQKRTYQANSGAEPRIVSVDYAARKRGQYYDPLLYWSAPWTDSFRYDDGGNLQGWTRIGPNSTTEFDAQGQPVDGRPVTYQMVQQPGAMPVLGYGSTDPEYEAGKIAGE